MLFFRSAYANLKRQEAYWAQIQGGGRVASGIKAVGLYAFCPVTVLNSDGGVNKLLAFDAAM